MKTNMSKTMGWICLALALATLAAAQSGSAAEPMGSTTNPSTGETISVYKNADGTHDVVHTDADGNEISRETHGNEPVTKPDGTKQPDSASTKDSDGNTTTITHNADGSKNKSVKDKDGKETSNEKIEKEPVTKVEKNKDPKGGSGVNPDNGVKTEVILNGDGTKTIIITKGGKEMYRETLKVSDEMKQDGQDLQGFPPIRTSAVYSAPEPVYVERRVLVVDRSPSFSIGLGFGFGHEHHSKCAPPCHKKCK
ncbi:MAG: hypothetical protein HY291_17260 [Planctomycetes bacterium]|nr:hypothetical protein [Planctomycetota bacterium]